jgi:hypothetical protein
MPRSGRLDPVTRQRVANIREIGACLSCVTLKKAVRYQIIYAMDQNLQTRKCDQSRPCKPCVNTRKECQPTLRKECKPTPQEECQPTSRRKRRKRVKYTNEMLRFLWYHRVDCWMDWPDTAAAFNRKFLFRRLPKSSTLHQHLRDAIEAETKLKLGLSRISTWPGLTDTFEIHYNWMVTFPCPELLCSRKGAMGFKSKRQLVEHRRSNHTVLVEQ